MSKRKVTPRRMGVLRLWLFCLFGIGLGLVAILVEGMRCGVERRFVLFEVRNLLSIWAFIVKVTGVSFVEYHLNYQ